MSTSGFVSIPVVASRPRVDAFRARALARRATVALLAAVALLAVGTRPARGALNVLATVPEWAALVQEIGGARVRVASATHALQDPHRIDARPSLIARARSADLLVATGADLEVGWLPLVVRESGNARVQPGRPGHFEAAAHVRLLEVPARLDRADGDVHPAGNPHVQTDPRNLLAIGAALADRMAALDPGEAATYRAGWASFQERLQAAIARWEQRAAPLRGTPVLVQHKSFPYLSQWLGLREVAALEPKPGVEPTSAHLAGVLDRLKSDPARIVLRPAYQNDAASRWIAQRAPVRVVVLPFTVGGNAEAGDLFSLFDDTIARLLAGVR